MIHLDNIDGPPLSPPEEREPPLKVCPECGDPEMQYFQEHRGWRCQNLASQAQIDEGNYVEESGCLVCPGAIDDEPDDGPQEDREPISYPQHSPGEPRRTP